MNVLTLFRRKPSVPPLRGEAPSARLVASTSGHLRREMVNMALRDTAHRHGLPRDWLAADTLVFRSSRGDFHCYVRILMSQCEPLLLAHASAFEASFTRRLSLLDATASSWLRGVAWQLGSAAPGLPTTMPHPSTWQKPRIAGKGPEAAAPEPAASEHVGLGSLLGTGDARYARLREAGGDAGDFQATQPFLAAEHAEQAEQVD